MKLELMSATGTTASQSEAQLVVPVGYKIISGGAYVDGSNNMGNMLTASYPASIRSWYARSSDQVLGDPATVKINVLALHDPNDEYDVQIGSQTSAMFQPYPWVTVTPLDGYVITGGGACANYGAVGAQQFLVASTPTADGGGWFAASREHVSAGPGSVTAYYIAVRRRDGVPLDRRIVQQTSPTAVGRPHEDVESVDGYQLVGGGAAVSQDTGIGNLLTASYPRVKQSDPTRFEWFGQSQDQQKFAAEQITVAAILLRD
ncbi:MAG TPA: hypothetical protein VF824_17215 [Thermoanaerobaculia bacterium]|jgi:hypothetical protein